MTLLETTLLVTTLFVATLLPSSFLSLLLVVDFWGILNEDIKLSKVEEEDELELLSSFRVCGKIFLSVDDESVEFLFIR